MAFPASPYIDDQDGALRIVGTLVSLSSVVVHFQEGHSPEKIIRSFPTLALAQVYCAIAYYLDNKELIDDYFAQVDR